MTIYRATKTISAINTALEKDQGAKYREWLGKVIPHIGDAFDPEESTFRSHLGASLIGRECARELWYSFRWATDRKHEGRMIRLFNRGHLEEARFIAMLLMIGCQVYQQDAAGNQFRISHAQGHFGGSGDGIIIGVPDVPDQPVLGEFKTHNDKSFTQLIDEGVREYKFEHYVQMNCYMRKMGINYALYLAINKNTDELYGEIIIINPELADQFLDRGEKIVFAKEAPAKINESPGFYKCRFCDHRPVCHLKKPPEINCRTCKHSNPIENGQWACTLHNTILTKEDQLKGCNEYKGFL